VKDSPSSRGTRGTYETSRCGRLFQFSSLLPQEQRHAPKCGRGAVGRDDPVADAAQGDRKAFLSSARLASVRLRSEMSRIAVTLAS
jgi:hypothetical protein